jgi:hypothetical protein
MDRVAIGFLRETVMPTAEQQEEQAKPDFFELDREESLGGAWATTGSSACLSEPCPSQSSRG